MHSLTESLLKQRSFNTWRIERRDFFSSGFLNSCRFHGCVYGLLLFGVDCFRCQQVVSFQKVISPGSRPENSMIESPNWVLFHCSRNMCVENFLVNTYTSKIPGLCVLIFINRSTLLVAIYTSYDTSAPDFVIVFIRNISVQAKFWITLFPMRSAFFGPNKSIQQMFLCGMN